MKNRLFLSIPTTVLVALVSGCSPQTPEATSPAPAEAPATSGAEQPVVQEAQSPATAGQPDLQTYDGSAAGIPVKANYPDRMEVSEAGSGEGVSVSFMFKPQGTHLDEARIHIFLPAGAATAADLKPLITEPGGLIASNGWVVSDIQSDGSEQFPYVWVKEVIPFSTDTEESGYILLGQTAGQAIQVTLLYPAEMAEAYWSAATGVLNSLEFDEALLPIEGSL